MAVLPIKVWTGTTFESVGSQQGAGFFYSASAPYNPSAGDFWFNTSTSVISVYTGSVFRAIPGIIVSNTQPTNISTGTMWFDTTNNVIRIYDGTLWDLIPAVSYSATSPTNPVPGSLWINSLSQELFVWTGSAWFSSGGGASKSTVMFLAGM